MENSRWSKFDKQDFYIDYPFEEVLYRYEFLSKKAYQKFYGTNQEKEVPITQKLFMDAVMYGDNITKEEYYFEKTRTIFNSVK